MVQINEKTEDHWTSDILQDEGRFLKVIKRTININIEVLIVGSRVIIALIILVINIIVYTPLHNTQLYYATRLSRDMKPIQRNVYF